MQLSYFNIFDSINANCKLLLKSFFIKIDNFTISVVYILCFSFITCLPEIKKKMTFINYNYLSFTWII